jgi:hypothetical protein
VVNFSQGCNTAWHVHDLDQIRIGNSAASIVATVHERREINVGGVVHIKCRSGSLNWRRVASYSAAVVASTLFHRDSLPGKVGRQMQTWVRFPEGWRVVAAHVSIIEAKEA